MSPYTSIPYLLNEDHKHYPVGFPSGTVGKESACQRRRHRGHGFDPCIRKILWRRKWQPIPVFLPRKSHGQRSLVSCSPWGCKESDMTERLSIANQYICTIFQMRKLNACDKAPPWDYFSCVRIQSRNKLAVPVAHRMKAKPSLVAPLTFNAQHDPAPAHMPQLVLATTRTGHPLSLPLHFYTVTL